MLSKRERTTIKTLVTKEAKGLDPEFNKDGFIMTLNWLDGAQLVFTWNREMSDVVKRVINEIDWKKENEKE